MEDRKHNTDVSQDLIHKSKILENGFYGILSLIIFTTASYFVLTNILERFVS